MHLERLPQELDSDKPGHRIDLYLDPEDYPTSEDDGLYLSSRMMECTYRGSIPGWGPDDKVHLIARKARDEAEQKNTLTLHLDGGGDLYFTIWKNFKEMQQSLPEGCKDFDTSPDAVPPFLTRDPANVIALQGIQSVRLHFT